MTPDPTVSTLEGSGRHPRVGVLPATPEALKTLAADFVREHRILPLCIEHGVLHLATADPGNEPLVENVRLLTGLEVQEVVAAESEIQERIGECYRVTVEQMIENLHAGDGAVGEAKNLHDIEVMANEPTVINLVNVIISTALRERASDIHLVPFEGTVELRYRIDGLLQIKPPPPRNLHAALVSRVKIMADMNIAERFMPQDGHIQIHHRGARVDIRVGTMPTKYGESLVMRLLEKNTKVQTPEELGLGAERAALLRRLVEKPHGLFLTTGPTGSGKTTTLYSILQGVYTPEKKIITIEDPIEYELTGVAQIPVRPTRQFTFATGLRAILRQDPDIVMVGEIRDSETAEIAIRAALTGHQVFSTLHTNDAPSSVTRLRDMGVEPFLITATVEAIQAQRLVRRVCQNCRAGYEPTREQMMEINLTPEQCKGKQFFYGEGCDKCNNLGFKGRTGLYELLLMTDDLRDMVSRGSSTDAIRNHTRKQGTASLRDSGLRALFAGTTTLDEVVRETVQEDEA